ncbi:MAG TPA: hypothetical protein VIN71_06405 [Pseudomonadales bacterium]
MNICQPFIIALVLLLSGTAFAEQVSYKELLRLNGQNIAQLKNGMSEAEVRKIMGSHSSAVRDGAIENPWKTEMLGDLKVLHYLVRRNPPFTPLLENQADPVILKKGKVIGVGRNYLKAAREQAAGASLGKQQGGSSKSLEERLKTLEELRKSGAISEADYKKQKQKILDSI